MHIFNFSACETGTGRAIWSLHPDRYTELVPGQSGRKPVSKKQKNKNKNKTKKADFIEESLIKAIIKISPKTETKNVKRLHLIQFIPFCKFNCVNNLLSSP